MEKIICKNNVQLCYQEINNSDFTRFEFWLNFGSIHDPKHQYGLAHIIEHLLLSQSLVNVDLYSFYNAYGYTTKERIRLYVTTYKDKALIVFESILNDLMKFEISDLIFKYQQAKLSFEIDKHKFGQVVSAFQTVENQVLEGTQYDRFPIGCIEDVNSLNLQQTKAHFYSKLKEYGMQITATGFIPNTHRLVDIINSAIFSVNPIRDSIDLSDKLFVSNEIICNELSNIHLILLNKYDKNLNYIDNYLCSKIFERYALYNFLKYPIELENFDYKAYKLWVLYISNKNNSDNRLEKFIKRLLSENIDKKIYSHILDYILHDILHKCQDIEECAMYNAEQLFFGTEINLSSLISSIENYNIDVFNQYLHHLQTPGIYTRVKGST